MAYGCLLRLSCSIRKASFLSHSLPCAALTLSSKSESCSNLRLLNGYTLVSPPGSLHLGGNAIPEDGETLGLSCCESAGSLVGFICCLEAGDKAGETLAGAGVCVAGAGDSAGAAPPARPLGTLGGLLGAGVLRSSTTDGRTT